MPSVTSPILIPRSRAHTLAGVSPRTWARWLALGLVGPVEVKVGPTKFYRTAELAEWASQPGRDGRLLDRVGWTQRQAAESAGGNN